MDFSIIDRGGVTQGQFAKLVGVSRITVNTWVKGHFQPRPTIRHRVAQALKLIAKAIESGKLPAVAVRRTEATDRVLDRIRAAVDTLEA